MEPIQPTFTGDTTAETVITPEEGITAVVEAARPATADVLQQPKRKELSAEQKEIADNFLQKINTAEEAILKLLNDAGIVFTAKKQFVEDVMANQTLNAQIKAIYFGLMDEYFVVCRALDGQYLYNLDVPAEVRLFILEYRPFDYSRRSEDENAYRYGYQFGIAGWIYKAEWPIGSNLNNLPLYLSDGTQPEDTQDCDDQTGHLGRIWRRNKEQVWRDFYHKNKVLVDEIYALYKEGAEEGTKLSKQLAVQYDKEYPPVVVDKDDYSDAAESRRYNARADRFEARLDRINEQKSKHIQENPNTPYARLQLLMLKMAEILTNEYGLKCEQIIG